MSVGGIVVLSFTRISAHYAQRQCPSLLTARWLTPRGHIRVSPASAHQRLPASAYCGACPRNQFFSGLELFVTSKPLRVLVIVVDAGVVLLSTFSGGPHTSLRENTFSLLISAFGCKSSPSLVTARLLLLLRSTSCLLYLPICCHLATNIGIDVVGSVPSTTLNFTWAVHLIGGTCITMTHSS